MSAEIGACAVGTLVQTSTGLVRIENIKTGDLVLSQPDPGGERTYRRVLETAVQEDRSIRCISFSRYDKRDEAWLLYVTDWQAFHTEEDGWVNARDLIVYEHHFKLADGARALMVGKERVLRTDELGVGWVGDSDSDDSPGCEVDFLTGEVLRQQVSSGWGPAVDLKVRVFTFGLENCSTYYATSQGVWIRYDPRP